MLATPLECQTLGVSLTYYCPDRHTHKPNDRNPRTHASRVNKFISCFLKLKIVILQILDTLQPYIMCIMNESIIVLNYILDTDEVP